MTTDVQKLATDKELRAQVRTQLAEYIAQAPDSLQSAHKWMKRVDVAGLGIVVAAFAYALYGSFTWASTNPIRIPVAWFAFATCLSLMATLFGLHAILIRAFPPVILPGKPQKFVSGVTAIWTGIASIVGGLIMAGLWIAFAYSTVTFDLAMIVPLINVLGIVMSIGFVLSIVFAIYQKVSQSH